MEMEKQRTLGAVLLLISVLAVPMVAIYLTRSLSSGNNPTSYANDNYQLLYTLHLQRMGIGGGMMSPANGSYGTAMTGYPAWFTTVASNVDDVSLRASFLTKFAALDTDAAILAYLQGLGGDTGVSVGFNKALAGGDVRCGAELREAGHFLGKAAAVVANYTDGGAVDVSKMSDDDFVQFDAFSRTGVASLGKYLNCMGAR
jgi:hypothetical protein